MYNVGITGLVETPLQGAQLVLQESIKMMLESGGGSIVNTGSIAQLADFWSLRK
jgi:NAD(P)-dependent dehydrogenase (short-subunit alcohol dehydrogenase family)